MLESTKQELINVWLRNQLANEQILDETSEQEKLSPKTLESVYAQFAHMHTFRYHNIEKQRKELLNGIIKLSSRNIDDKDLSVGQLKLSAEKIANVILLHDKIKPIKGYKNGCIGWIIYMINHESHHRSKAMTLLKQDGVKFSKRLKSDLWNWK